MWTPYHRLPIALQKTKIKKRYRDFEDGANMQRIDVENVMLDDLEVGHSSLQGHRANMEDKHLITKTSLDGHYLVAIFDGHAGGEASTYLASNFLATFEQEPKWKEYKNKSPDDRFNSVNLICEMLVDVFIHLDEQLRELNTQSGSTAVCTLISPTNLFTASVGDSRGVLGMKNGSIYYQSEDHKPSNMKEKRRIISAGGFVYLDRVNGELAMSRAFGDFQYKNNVKLDISKQMVISIPDIAVHTRNGEESILVLACDGVWDIMSNSDAIEFLRALIFDDSNDTYDSAFNSTIVPTSSVPTSSSTSTTSTSTSTTTSTTTTGTSLRTSQDDENDKNDEDIDDVDESSIENLPITTQAIIVKRSNKGTNSGDNDNNHSSKDLKEVDDDNDDDMESDLDDDEALIDTIQPIGSNDDDDDNDDHDHDNDDNDDYNDDENNRTSLYKNDKLAHIKSKELIKSKRKMKSLSHSHHSHTINEETQSTDIHTQKMKKRKHHKIDTITTTTTATTITTDNSITNADNIEMSQNESFDSLESEHENESISRSESSTNILQHGILPIMNKVSAAELADALIDVSLKLGSTDNISALIVKFP